jgi:hypothetical protein
LAYAGQVIVAMAILLLGILAANFFAGIVNSTVKASGLHKGETLGSLTKWAIVIFSVIAAYYSRLGAILIYLSLDYVI